MIPNAFIGENIEMFIFYNCYSRNVARNVQPNEESKGQTDFLNFIQGHSFWTELPNTYLKIFSQKILGFHMEYSLDKNFIDITFVLGYLTKMAATPIYGKTKYV